MVTNFVFKFLVEIFESPLSKKKNFFTKCLHVYVFNFYTTKIVASFCIIVCPSPRVIYLCGELMNILGKQTDTARGEMRWQKVTGQTDTQTRDAQHTDSICLSIRVCMYPSIVSKLRTAFNLFIYSIYFWLIVKLLKKFWHIWKSTHILIKDNTIFYKNCLLILFKSLSEIGLKPSYDTE